MYFIEKYLALRVYLQKLKLKKLGTSSFLLFRTFQLDL